MKIRSKIFLFLIVSLVGGSVAMYAEPLPNYQAGDVVFGAGIKSATPGLGTDWGEFNVVNKTTGVAHDAKPGITSIGGELQGVYFVNPWLAVGESVSEEYFDHDVVSGVNMDVDTRIYNYLLLARVFINPSQKYKVYFPVGVGVGHISSRIDMDPAERFNYTGFAAQAGVGVSRFLNEIWSLAFELRYNYNKFHATETNDRGEVYRVYPGVNYVSISLRLDYRF